MPVRGLSRRLDIVEILLGEGVLAMYADMAVAGEKGHPELVSHMEERPYYWSLGM